MMAPDARPPTVASALDPITLFGAEPGEPGFYWEQPDRCHAIVAGGDAPATGDALRVSVGAFDPATPPDAVWEGLPRRLGRTPAWVQEFPDLPPPRDGDDAAPRATGRSPAVVDWPLECAERERWGGAVEQALAGIEQGELAKVVVARRRRIRRSGGVAIERTLRRLRARYPSSTLYAVREGGAVFLGASPERLAAVRGRQLRSVALAGSARHDGRDLLRDLKERAEHAHVVRHLREALTPLCDSLQIPDAPEVLSLANLRHLQTPIAGRLAGVIGVAEVAARLHPTPAVAGAPTAAALRHIRQREPFDRGWYAGPIGWSRRREGEYIVALRGALIRGDEAWLFAGCGIVAGADATREWDESAAKLETMTWALS